MITPAVAPHAPYSLTRNDLELTASFSEENSIPVLSHLAEMPFEEAYTLERHNMRPVPFYDSCGLLTDRSIMAHCIFTEKHDRTTLISRGTGIAHNTGANAKSGKGIAPAYEFYIEGARIGLGTDGPMSGNTMDMIHQLNAVSKFQKTRLRDPTIMTPDRYWKWRQSGERRHCIWKTPQGPSNRGNERILPLSQPILPQCFRCTIRTRRLYTVPALRTSGRWFPTGKYW